MPIKCTHQLGERKKKRNRTSILFLDLALSLSPSCFILGGLLGPRIPCTTIGAFIALVVVEATRSKPNTDRWEEAFARLLSSMSSKIDELLHRMTQLEIAHMPSRAPSLATGTTVTNPNYRMKLEVPRFDGSDPEGWIFKIT